MAHELGGHDRTSPAHRPQRRQVAPGEVGMVDQADEHGGHPAGERGPLGLDQLEHQAGLERRHQHGGGRDWHSWNDTTWPPTWNSGMVCT